MHIRAMKTKEELLAMSHEELANYTVEVQFKASMYDAVEQKNSRMKELLAAVGIVYETYKRELRRATPHDLPEHRYRYGRRTEKS